MSTNSITVEAIFENGVLRPIEPLPLASRQQVTLIIQWPTSVNTWPEDVAAIYQEINAEDRGLAEEMWATIKETWPLTEGQP